MSEPAADRAAAAVELACPACRAGVVARDSGLICEGCGRAFNSVAGIPELRLSYPDAYLTQEQDLARARELEARFDELDFAGLLWKHWQEGHRTPGLAERAVAGDLVSVTRSESYLASIENQRGAPLGPGDRFLEIGCGTAGLSAVAAGRAGEVVASDLSMRWLVLARKSLSEAGIDGVRLVCCAAEQPAFAPKSFDVIVASDVIEHVDSQDGFAAACADLLRPGGMLFLATPNRYSLGLEPHVRLWGVGYLPRPLANRYVRAVRRSPYDHVRLLSSRGLRRLLRRHGFSVEIVAPEIPPGTQDLYSGLELRLVRLYNRLRRLATVRRGLLAVGPFFHVFARKGAG